MKNFYRNTTFSLVLFISVFIGFSGEIAGKIEIKRFIPYLSIKSFFILSVALLVFALPDLIVQLIKRGNTDELNNQKKTEISKEDY